jgi:hypothetical protein
MMLRIIIYELQIPFLPSHLNCVYNNDSQKGTTEGGIYKGATDYLSKTQKNSDFSLLWLIMAQFWNVDEVKMWCKILRTLNTYVFIENGLAYFDYLRSYSSLSDNSCCLLYLKFIQKDRFRLLFSAIRFSNALLNLLYCICTGFECS